MIIVHNIDDFLIDLFPQAKAFQNSSDRLNKLKELVYDFYTYGPFTPKVTVENDILTVEVDTEGIVDQSADFKKVVNLCERRDFDTALPILQELIKKNPTNSEYHRIYGQILSEQGNQDDAVNHLIDALRWNPRNGYALLMMGNIFAREKDDFATAKKYFDSALDLNPNDNIAINNLGSNLLHLGKLEEGLRYLEKAHEIDPKYPNSSYGIALANDKLGNTLTAFEFAIATLKNCKPTDKELFNHAQALAMKTSGEWIKSGTGREVLQAYKSQLEKEGGVAIRIEEHEDIPTAAKIEFAENYRRDHHLIKYKPGHPAVEHLMMHELVHLEFVLQARRERQNQLFITSGEKKQKFIKDHESQLKTIIKKGYEERSVTNFIHALFDGINSQIYNAPIDLFIEDLLYNRHKELRPYQFVSLYSLAIEYNATSTNKQVLALTPKRIQFANKVLNLVFTIHFKELFGVDLGSKYTPTPGEIRQAEEFFQEYQGYRDDRTAGEEYELIQHWAEDLKISDYFELVDEEAYRKRSDSARLLEDIQKDPFGTETDRGYKDEQMAKFQKSQQAIGLNMAIVMFMVDALRYFKDKSQTEIKQAAMEIAMLGTQGITPGGEQKYKLASVPGKDFSGYHLLAYYYVSWSLAIPEMLDALKLPFDKEYRLAEQMFKDE